VRRSMAAVLGMVLAATLSLVAAPASAAPYCGIRWGSLPESGSTLSGGPLVNVRSGRHACYDRLVIDVAGPASGYDVRYVRELVQDGSGFVVPARGGARLQVVVRAPGYDDVGGATYAPADDAHAVDVTGYRTFRQVVWMSSFEGQSELGVGVRARLPFRVFTLDGPGAGSRVVLDVAHRW
jgi:hypothetical protein